jgi:type IV secretory pathway VirB10-like protein
VPGGAAPANLDPYGPVAPVPTAPTAPGGGTTGVPQAPPVDYTQAPVPATQPTLTPREQFLLARRQAVLGNVVARRQPAAPKPQGTWADLNIPTATSSYPQDMSRVLTMDRVISAVLVRPYDSRSSQQVVAQVDRNIYGAHGRSILIPRGSQIIGIAQGGGERVAIEWKQIIRPDGARFMFNATAADAMGQAGVPGRVNERLLKRYGSILLGTILSAGTAGVFGAEETASGGLGGENGRNTGAIIGDIVRQDIQKITQDIVQRNQNIQPIISVPAGTRITVVPTMDIQMRPLQGQVQQVRSYPIQQNGGARAPSFNPSQGAGNGEQRDPNAPIDFDAQQPVQARRNNAPSPLPAQTVPTTGATPPWDSN